MYKTTYKGRYRVSNPFKYRGNLQDVIYRSSWELKFMKWCDTNDSIQKWGSEIIAIPYKSPLDNKIHRYFVDFYMQVKTTNGVLKTYLIEVKPHKQTIAPEFPGKRTKKYLIESMTYLKNQAKWRAANEYARDRGWEFKIITEYELGITQPK